MVHGGGGRKVSAFLLLLPFPSLPYFSLVPPERASERASDVIQAAFGDAKGRLHFLAPARERRPKAEGLDDDDEKTQK